MQPAIAVFAGGVAVFGGVGVASHEPTHVRAVGKTTNVHCDQKALGVVVHADFNESLITLLERDIPKRLALCPFMQSGERWRMRDG